MKSKVLISFSLCCIDTCGAFSPAKPLISQRRSSVRPLFSTAKPVNDKTNVGQQGRQRPDEAVKKLERQLELQKADIKKTESLLQSLKQGHVYDTNNIDAEGSLSFAESIMSGFDYGFNSRSEGATVIELQGGFEGYGPPANLFTLGARQFWRNWDAIKGEYKDEEDNGTNS
jgi:hypothetical protein